MKTAQFAYYALLANFLLTAALVFPSSAGAAAGNVQSCQPSTSCTVGEFLYDDEYASITDATCTITTRYPDGTLYLNSQALVASADGWYSHEFTAPATTGLYRSQVCCTAGSDYLCLDKTFEVKEQSSLTQSDVSDAVWNATRSAYTTSGSFGEAIQNSIASASDIASATWSYSGRTLSSFGTLIADIWTSATRTLTGAGLDSGSLAKQSDVTALSTKVDSVQEKANSIKTDTDNIEDKVDTLKTKTQSIEDRVGAATGTNIVSELTSIKTLTNETRNLVEKIVNKPTAVNILENGVQISNDLQSKIESTKKVGAQLLTNSQYIGSRASVVKEKWTKLKQPEISSEIAKLSKVLGQKNDDVTKSSVFSEVNWLSGAWTWTSVKSVVSQTSLAKSKLDQLQTEVDNNGKTTAAYGILADFISTTNEMQASISNKAQKGTLFADAAFTQQYVGSLDEKSKNVDNMLASINGTILTGNLNSSKNTGNFTFNGLVKNIDMLARDILSLNRLPKLELSVFNKSYPTLSLRDAKNKVLGLKGVIVANKQLLAFEANKAFASTWLEEGSIIFKTLITNPSRILSQEAPIKYYLPVEVKEENIMKIDDGLEVGYDSEKGQFYVSGSFTLSPGETKTVAVEVDDNVYTIQKEVLDGVRKQAAELAGPLKNTAYFAQGVTIKGDIDVSLDKVEALIKSANTPEAKIKNYRDAMIEMKAVYEKRDKLQELVTAAGSVGTMFGFVGGSQALAVWGTIIIMTAGFVFLALYMKVLRNNEQTVPIVEKKKAKKKTNEEVEEPKNKFRLKSLTKIIVGGVVVALIGSFVSGVIISKNLFSSKKTDKQPSVVQVKKEKVLGQQKPIGNVKIFVPEGSIVNIYSAQDLASSTVTSITKTTEVAKMEEKDEWVKIALLAEDKNPSQIAGWIENDFVQEVSEESGEDEMAVVVNDDISYLKVRSGPTIKESEVAKAYPGEEYLLNDEIEGWFQITLNNGGFGWISKDFSHKQ